MHVRLLAVGDRQPDWVDEAVRIYKSRFPREWRFRIDVLATARRVRGENVARAVVAEGQQLLARLKADEQVVLLDERGKQMTSLVLGKRLSAWQCDGRDLCFVIGGPDGVDRAVRERANVCWALSELTLPHGLARVVFTEQLYRAWSLSSGHPYHRE